MVVRPNDIRFFYSGGSTNEDPLASLGGQISSTQVINSSQENVFNNVTLIEADNGMTDYRCVYVKNIGAELWRTTVIWREESTQSGFDGVFIGLGSAIIDGTEQLVQDRFTAPLNVNFASPDSKESALQIGDLAPGSFKAIWIKRVVQPLARTFKNNTFKLRVELGNPAGGGTGGTPPGTPPGLPPGSVQCQTGYHAVNGVCIPDTVPPITGGGGENILWQSTAWSNGRDRTLTGSGERDPDDPTLSFGAGENRELIIKGASDPGFVNHTGARTRIYVDQNGNVANNYNASLEIQKFYPNASLDNLSLRLRSRHQEDDPPSNRFGGYNMALSHNSVSAQRENYHNDHTNLSPSSISLPNALVNGTEYGIRYSVRDTTDGKVELKLELKGGAYGTSYVEVAKSYDNNPLSYMLDKQLYLNNRSYFWIRTNGDSPEDVRYGFVILRDLDKQSVTSCPAGYTLKNGICVANTLPPPGTQPPPTGGGGATIADYVATAVGDTTCGSTAQTIVSRMAARNPNFHLPLGDYTYTSSTGCWLNMMAPLKPKILSMNIGNHDDEEDESNTLRAQYLAWAGLSQPYHAFTFRNTFVLTLYTYAPFGFGTGSAQYQFAQQQLAAARANPAIDWIIVNFHKPIYTASSNHSGYTAFKDIYHPLFDQYKVDLCLSGHVHNYQRTKPLKYNPAGAAAAVASNLTTNYINLVNPIFVIAGCGGREISGIADQPSWNAGQREGFGYVLLSWSNNGKRLTGRHYDQTDTLRDEWTMDKTSVSQPPPSTGGGGTTPPPTTGQIDSNGIKWLLATGEQTVIAQTRTASKDFRWSRNYSNIAANGFEATLYGTFSGVASGGHCALKHWGGNHSGDCQYEEDGSCCCWYDTGIRADGSIQTQIERPHPSNDDFTCSTCAMNNIGVGMDGKTIGLKWIVYPIVEGGHVGNGGIKLKMYVDTSGFSASKPQNQWRLVYDIIDTGQILGDYIAPQEQEIEVRNSDTSSTNMYAGGIHVRRLSRANINAGGTTGGGGGTPTPSPAQPPTNVQYFYDSTSTQNDPQSIQPGDYDETEEIIKVPETYNPNDPVAISGGYINIEKGNTTNFGAIWIDYYKKPRFTQDDLPGFNTAVSFEFLYEGQGTIKIVDGNMPEQEDFPDDLNTIFSGYEVYIQAIHMSTTGYQQEASTRVRYYDNPEDPLTLGKNGVRSAIGQYTYPGGRTITAGNTYKVFYLVRTNKQEQEVVLNLWIDFGDSAGWVKIIEDHKWDRFSWFPGNVLPGYDDSEQIIQGPDLVRRHRFSIHNSNVSVGSSGTDLKVKNIKVGTMPYLPDPVITNPPDGGGTTPPPDNQNPPSGTGGNDANGIKMIYPTKASGDTFLWDLNGSNTRIAGQNVTATRASTGGPWSFVKQTTEPMRIFVYTKENSISNINISQLSQSPPVSTFNHNTLANLGYFYQARDWKNVEFTIYMSSSTQLTPDPQTTFISMIVRSANHTTANGGCGGSSYHADFNFQTGGVRFKKEQYHNSYAIDPFTTTNIGSTQGRYVGLKFVIWNRASDGKVEMELWVDKDVNNNWVKYLGKIDADDWGTGAAQCAGTPPGKKITWGSPVVILKNDTASGIFISYLSCREITPPS